MQAKSVAQAAKAADAKGEMGNVMDHARQVFKIAKIDLKQT